MRGALVDMSFIYLGDMQFLCKTAFGLLDI